MDFRTLRSVAPIAFVLALSTGVRAEDRTGLGKFVPEGVHFFASWTSSAEVGAVQAHYEKAFGRLVDSGVGQDSLDVATTPTALLKLPGGFPVAEPRGVSLDGRVYAGFSDSANADDRNLPRARS